MKQLNKLEDAEAFGEAYGGVAGRFILHGETEILVVAPDVEGLRATFIQMGEPIDEGMTGPVTVFLIGYPASTTPEKGSA